MILQSYCIVIRVKFISPSYAQKVRKKIHLAGRVANCLRFLPLPVASEVLP